MTFEEFENQLFAKNILNKCNCAKYKCSESLYADYCSEEKILYNHWLVGGLTGGNCWGDVADNCVTAEDEGEFNTLLRIIKNFYPNIGYFDFVNFIQQYSVIKEKHESEYYGNYYEYKIRSIKLIDLYKFLIDKGVVK